jgi:hypothetical protein
LFAFLCPFTKPRKKEITTIIQIKYSTIKTKKK